MSDVVYFAKRADLVKIGTTGGLKDRLRAIGGVELLATMPGDRHVERAIHELFSSLRHQGEWFFLQEPLVGFIQAVALAEAVADTYHARVRSGRNTLTPWSYLRERIIPRAAQMAIEASPQVIPMPDDLLTLREACDQGVLPWKYEAAKKRMQRSLWTPPRPAGKRGVADLYRRDELTTS